MNAERFAAIEEVFQAAVDQPPDKRAAFLEAACRGDVQLRAEVEALLAVESGALEVPGVTIGALAGVRATPALSPGSRLGPYEVEAFADGGGMGEVYRARDTRLGRTVAIKILREDLATDPKRRRRFEQEARAVSALNHPHICTLHDIGSHSGIDYLVMEYLEGRTLAERLTTGPLPLGEVWDCAIQIADALAAAHSQGIVHRDLKPGNVMLTQYGVKLLDFGLARLTPTVHPNDASAALSASGWVVGTVPYMSPEQLQGLTTDARTDLFAFGAVLYEMLTGTQAFTGGSPASVAAAVLEHEPPPLCSLQPLTPPALERLVKRCLEKDRGARWQTATDIAAELRWMSGRSAPIESADRIARRRSTSRRKWVWITVVAALAAAAAGGVLARLYAPRGDAFPGATFTAQRVTRLTDSGLASLAALSPDGRYAVHVKLEGGLPALWVRQTATPSDVRILPPSGVEYDGLAFSPDANYVYYVARERNSNEGALYRLAVLGGTQSRVLEGANANTAPEFSGDGRHLALVGYSGLGATRVVIADLDGTGTRVIPPPSNDLEFDGTPAWSPDGRTILVSTIARSRSSRTLSAINVATGTATALDTAWPAPRALKWMPDGRSLVMEIGSDLWQVAYPSGERRRITNDLNGYHGVSMSADGSLLATIQITTQASVWVVPARGGEARAVRMDDVGREAGKDGLCWTPEGRLVFTARGQVWTAAPDGSQLRQLTSDSGKAADPAVSPDGRTIYYTRTANDGVMVRQAIWRMASDGTDQKPLTKGITAFRPIPSPDGRWIYFTAFDEGRFIQPMRIAAVGGEASPVSQARFGLRQFSPDGTEMIGLTYNDVNQRAECIVMATDGSSSTLLGSFADTETSDFGCRFHSGRALVSYVAFRAGVANIYVRPIAGGVERQLTHFARDTGPLIHKAAWSHDGRLAVSRGNRASDVVLISAK